MKNYKHVYGLIFSIFFFVQPLLCMYEAILNQFNNDIAPQPGKSSKVTIQELSGELLETYAGFASKIPASETKENVETLIATELSSRESLPVGKGKEKITAGAHETLREKLKNEEMKGWHALNELSSRIGLNGIDVLESMSIKELKEYKVQVDHARLLEVNVYPMLKKLIEEAIKEKKEKKFGIAKELVSLLPDKKSLEALGLCDLSEKVERYSVFVENKGEFESKDLDLNKVNCSVVLGKFKNWNRTLFQLKSLNQSELSNKTSLDSALCATHALRNCMLIRDYAITGDKIFLKNLEDLQEAANFLLNLQGNGLLHEWLSVNEVEKTIDQLSKINNLNMEHISVIGGALLLDKNLLQSEALRTIFNYDEFEKAQKIKTEIRNGLKKEYYFHALIILNEEEIGIRLGHFFAFAIIKVKNEIQYVVLDTLSTYHLYPGSHQLNRLRFIIDNIEKGSSSIILPHLRLHQAKKTGFFTPHIPKVVWQPEKDLNARLAEEQLSLETGGLPTRSLNAFSDKIIREGAWKILTEENKQNLEGYFGDIKRLHKLFNESVYAKLYVLIEGEIKRREEKETRPVQLSDDEIEKLNHEIISPTIFCLTVQETKKFHDSPAYFNKTLELLKKLNTFAGGIVVFGKKNALAKLTLNELEEYEAAIYQLKAAGLNPYYINENGKKILPEHIYPMLDRLINKELERRRKRAGSFW